MKTICLYHESVLAHGTYTSEGYLGASVFQALAPRFGAAKIAQQGVLDFASMIFSRSIASPWLEKKSCSAFFPDLVSSVTTSRNENERYTHGVRQNAHSGAYIRSVIYSFFTNTAPLTSSSQF